MINNIDVAVRIMDMLQTSIEASDQLIFLLGKDDITEARQLSLDLKLLYTSIREFSDELDEQESGMNLTASIKSIIASLARIQKFIGENNGKAVHKIEYELIPLTEELAGNFYFWGCVYPDTEKIDYYNKYEKKELFRNIYLEEAQKTGQYKYELTIYVLAYNKLEYTKMCVNSLLQHLPNEISYELIFVNHGSTDGTKEYFESLNPDKQLDIEVNGGGRGAVIRIAEGRYSVQISNDILITENAINNLYDCISADSSIGWAVPSTPNVSNLQTILLEYNDFEEMYSVAEINNKRDIYRREQRIRLCNPIDIRDIAAMYKTEMIGSFQSKNTFLFPDDRDATFFRRNGYKMMLVKDAYCYHFGSITLRDEIENPYSFYNKGREEFQRVFGIDPWDYSLCYDMNLFGKLLLNKNGKTVILGINCGMGSNSLKVKEVLKEQMHNLDVELYNYTDEKCYLDDLKGVSDFATFKTLDDILEEPIGKKYDYIIVERNLEEYDRYKEFVSKIIEGLNENGMLMIRLKDGKKANWCARFLKKVTRVQCSDFQTSGMCWIIYEKKSIEL